VPCQNLNYLLSTRSLWRHCDWHSQVCRPDHRKSPDTRFLPDVRSSESRQTFSAIVPVCDPALQVCKVDSVGHVVQELSVDTISVRHGGFYIRTMGRQKPNICKLVPTLSEGVHAKSGVEAFCFSIQLTIPIDCFTKGLTSHQPDKMDRGIRT